MDWVAYALLIAFVLAYLSTPLAGLFARKIGALDRPGIRKIHSKPIPRLGGLAIAGSFYAALGLVWWWDSTHGRLLATAEGLRTLRLVLCGLPIVLLGLVDDLKSLRPLPKLLVEVGVAVGAIYIGFGANSVVLPVFGSTVMGGWGTALLVLWIVGVTNAVNLMDGLDGLAAGIGALVSLAVCAMAAISENFDTALAAGLLSGACLGFLRHNWHPAKIFMGDTGSLFIGFLLAVLSVEGTQKRTVAAALTLPILILGVPVIDTLASIFRRTLMGRSPMSPDRGHLHHLLLRSGLNQRKVAFVLYGITVMLGIVAAILTFGSRMAANVALLVMLAVSALAYRQFGYTLKRFVTSRVNWRNEAADAMGRLEAARTDSETWAVLTELLRVLEIQRAGLYEATDQAAIERFSMNAKEAAGSDLPIPFHVNGEIAGELRVAGAVGSRSATLMAAAHILDPILERFGSKLLNRQGAGQTGTHEIHRA